MKAEVVRMTVVKLGGTTIGMTSFHERDENRVWWETTRVYGNTFAIKESLKEAGFKWNAEASCWERKVEGLNERKCEFTPAELTEKLAFWKFMFSKYQVGFYEYFEEIVQAAARADLINVSERREWQMRLAHLQILNEHLGRDEETRLKALAGKLLGETAK